jgi:hypothetical protein
MGGGEKGEREGNRIGTNIFNSFQFLLFKHNKL